MRRRRRAKLTFFQVLTEACDENKAAMLACVLSCPLSDSQCCLRSSCLGLRAKIFLKRASKQAGAAFKAKQGVLLSHMCRTAQPGRSCLKMEKKGDTAEVPLSKQVQKCTNLAEVAIQTHTRRTWQKLPQPKDVQKCTIWQKCPRTGEEV